MWYGDFRIQRKNQLTVPLKYLILVLLLMDFFHTFILSEKTRFGYPFVVPYLVFFVGVFCNAPNLEGDSGPPRDGREPSWARPCEASGAL